MVETIPHIRYESGQIITPFGSDIIGIRITVGGILDQATVKRTYDDIEAIFKSNNESFKTFEEKTENGTFKSYVVSTS